MRLKASTDSVMCVDVSHETTENAEASPGAESLKLFRMLCKKLCKKWFERAIERKTSGKDVEAYQLQTF